MQTMEAEYEEGAVSLCSSNQDQEREAAAGDKLASDSGSHSGSDSGSGAALEHFCGGWVGWHCEGAPLKSIFGLLMWSELFPTRAAPAPASRDEGSGSDGAGGEGEEGTAGLAAASSSRCVSRPPPPPAAGYLVADVFQTPYQDAPLDLLTPGGLFYLNRREGIEQKLRWIEAAAAEDIIAFMGEVSRGTF